jgi:hypothetical protein
VTEVTEVPQSRVQVWAKLVMHQQELVTSAQVSYDSACTIRLEKKHKLKEQEDKLAELVRGGPDGLPKPDPQMRLDLGDDEESLDDGDSELDEISITDRQRRILAAGGILTVSDFQALYDGEHEDYPNGPGDVQGVTEQDVVEMNRAYHEYNDEADDDDSPDTIAYEAPMSKASSVKVAVPAEAAPVVTIRFKQDFDEIDIESGDTCEATHIDGAFMAKINGEMLSFTQDEVEIVTEAAVS